MTTTSLTITPVSVKEKNHLLFKCIGSIDAHAESELASFPTIDAGTQVTLDFAEVQRVNSMGLSLLLKLFEEWEQNDVKVSVCNLNRMIKMLFKITGLGRFLEGSMPLASTGTGGKATVENRSTPSPAPPFHARTPDTEALKATVSKNAKLSFVASLQSGNQLSGWFLMNTYLQRKLQRAIHFEQFQVGQEITEHSADILFAKPFEACSAIENNGFLPLMCPDGEADEVVILARADDKRKMSALTEAKVVTATQGSFVYLLGRFLCDENDMNSSQFNFTFAKNEIKSLMTLMRGQADLLFMLKKTYDSLSSLSRKSVRVVDESATQLAFHIFCIAPHLEDLKESLCGVLDEMAHEEKGQKILADIHVERWRKPETAELKMLSMVYNKYK